MGKCWWGDWAAWAAAAAWPHLEEVIRPLDLK